MDASGSLVANTGSEHRRHRFQPLRSPKTNFFKKCATAICARIRPQRPAMRRFDLDRPSRDPFEMPLACWDVSLRVSLGRRRWTIRNASFR